MSQEKKLDKKNFRQIQSFVRRGGRLTKGQNEALESLMPVYGIADGERLLNWPLLWSNQSQHPENQFPKKRRIIEIGFGNGEALLKMASDRADSQYIGIDVHEPGIGRVLASIQEHNINNVRIVSGDAVAFIKRIPLASIDGIHIFFPDPWTKKRHHKRRLIQLPFVNSLVQYLKTGGYLWLATDVENYAEQMAEVLSEQPLLYQDNQKQQELTSLGPRPETKFERRGLKLGHGVWDFISFKSTVNNISC